MLQLSSCIEAGEAGSSCFSFTSWFSISNRQTAQSSQNPIQKLKQRNCSEKFTTTRCYSFYDSNGLRIAFHPSAMDLYSFATLCGTSRESCVMLKSISASKHVWACNCDEDLAKQRPKNPSGAVKHLVLGHWRTNTEKVHQYLSFLFSSFHFSVPWMTSGKKEINESSLGEGNFVLLQVHSFVA